ncbi:hypothetical protein KIPB_003485 [Kipferlia bialata]|uniref:AAA+ ATPase domain-containing protein n=1 Tax=Kipferlia bialata TaxID=797122 RepID=A0A391NT08_9EUKA|nr:hypothetical protein KIPB_003485 [Kipferlia bialata]|eukprot:g3485.t1
MSQTLHHSLRSTHCVSWMGERRPEFGSAPKSKRRPGMGLQSPNDQLLSFYRTQQQTYLEQRTVPPPNDMPAKKASYTAARIRPVMIRSPPLKGKRLGTSTPGGSPKLSATDRGMASVPNTPKGKGQSRSLPDTKGASKGAAKGGTGPVQDQTASTNFRKQPTTIRLSDLGGMDRLQKNIQELVLWPFQRTHIFKAANIVPPRGILIAGPPGCGKTALANALANEVMSTGEVAFFSVAGPELVGGVSGEAEGRIRTLFTQAAASAPSLVFIDEIEVVATHKDKAQREMEKRIVAQLQASMDALHPSTCRDGMPVVVLGATSKPAAVEPALRRPGRFDRELSIGIPDRTGREAILRRVTAEYRLGEDVDLSEVARLTPGYVGADLDALAREAGMSFVRRAVAAEDAAQGQDMGDDVPAEGEGVEDLVMQDYVDALKEVQPAAKREGFVTVPDVTWADIGALSHVREELEMSVLEPIRNPADFERMGISVQSGVLLYGPPGCGKTLLAKAIANSTGANFISIKGPELLNKYVGESERAVRGVFQRARSSAPCVLFFDELDSLCPKRGSEANQATERVVNQLLTELDGLETGRQGLFVIAATNRPDIIDPAMLRPGRLDKLIFVPLPTVGDRRDILGTACRDMPLGASVDLARVADLCSGFSGADLAMVARESAMHALRERKQAPAKAEAEGEAEVFDATEAEPSQVYVEPRHFAAALAQMGPSVSVADARRYEAMRESMRGKRGHAIAPPSVEPSEDE